MTVRQWIIAGLLVAVPFVGIVMAALALATGLLFGNPKPEAKRTYKVPAFADLLTCTAAFSSQVIWLKSVAHESRTERLEASHRSYRRLHRLMRQVGRRDGIDSVRQTALLKRAVNALPHGPDVAPRCREMAALPIARRRLSQIEIGQSKIGQSKIGESEIGN